MRDYTKERKKLEEKRKMAADKLYKSSKIVNQTTEERIEIVEEFHDAVEALEKFQEECSKITFKLVNCNGDVKKCDVNYLNGVKNIDQIETIEMGGLDKYYRLIVKYKDGTITEYEEDVEEIGEWKEFIL